MPKTDLRKKFGCVGEEIAEKWLKRKGYKSVQKNYLIRGGQIDMIMEQKDRTIVFVEVKIRRNRNAEIRIGKMQILSLQRAAQTFLEENKMQNRIWRIDLVWINITAKESGKRVATIRHHQNILGR